MWLGYVAALYLIGPIVCRVEMGKQPRIEGHVRSTEEGGGFSVSRGLESSSSMSVWFVYDQWKPRLRGYA